MKKPERKIIRRARYTLRIFDDTTGAYEPVEQYGMVEEFRYYGEVFLICHPPKKSMYNLSWWQVIHQETSALLVFPHRTRDLAFTAALNALDKHTRKRVLNTLEEARTIMGIEKGEA